MNVGLLFIAALVSNSWKFHILLLVVGTLLHCGSCMGTLLVLDIERANGLQIVQPHFCWFCFFFGLPQQHLRQG